MAEREVVEVRSRAEWRAWLEANHTQSESIWLCTFKRHHPDYLSYEDIVQEALCYGWVDGLMNTRDADRSLLLLSPRRKKSGWSRPNKERVELLIREGKMTPAGIAVVERAKADGTWSMLDDVENLIVPEDLAQALAALPPAEEQFAAFPRSVRRGILENIHQAKRPETRAKRIALVAEMAQQGKRAFFEKPPG